MPRLTLPAALWVFAILFCTAAEAQDFGTAWIDRVTHQLIDEEGPLNPHPVEFKASAGELYSYDSNLFLTHTNHTSDSIFTTFANAGLKYAQPVFDAEADLTVNYNASVHTANTDYDEERFFGRARYQGSKISLQIAEILRRESTPTDVVFTSRVSRVVSNTTPFVTWHINEAFSVEAQSDLQYVRYLRQQFDIANNFNTRSSLTGAYKTGWNDLDALLQVGYLTIDYSTAGAPPNASGYFGRVGARGEVSPNLNVIALAGFTGATSHDFVGTNKKAELSTADIEIHIAYIVSEVTTVYGDYVRRFGFGAGGTPFEVIDSFDAIAEYSIRDDLKLKGRLAYSRAHPVPVISPVRGYGSVSVGSEYKAFEHLLIEGQVTYRAGSAQTGPSDAGDFSDVIFSLGVVWVF
jgi:hypothetical protein